MQALDIDFFEEYKHLDRVCSDMYSTRNGVSQYIADMKRQSAYGERVIPEWNKIHKELLHLRHLRNQIAHEYGQYQICVEEDIDKLKDFSNAILAQEDPLALLQRYNLQSRCETPNSRQVEAGMEHDTESDLSTVSTLAFAVMILVLICLIVVVVAVVGYTLVSET